MSTLNPLSMDILVEAQINQPDFGCYNLKRSPLHCKLIYLIPVGFFDLFASERTVRNSTIFIYVPTAEGLAKIIQNVAIQEFEHLDAV